MKKATHADAVLIARSMNMKVDIVWDIIGGMNYCVVFGAGHGGLDLPEAASAGAVLLSGRTAQTCNNSTRETMENTYRYSRRGGLHRPRPQPEHRNRVGDHPAAAVRVVHRAERAAEIYRLGNSEPGCTPTGICLRVITPPHIRLS